MTTNNSSAGGSVSPENGGDSGEDQYVETQGPPVPQVAYKVINPVVELLLRSPLHPLLSDNLMLISFTGRKSGTEYTTPVGYWRKDGNIIVTTHSPWWRNLKGGARVEVQLQGQRREGMATPHPDPETVASFMQAFIERNGVDAPRRLGIEIHGDREPTYEEFVTGVEGTIVIEIVLTDRDEETT